MTHRPTTLSLLAERCPAALDHYDRGASRDVRVFAVGTAAHEALHALHHSQDLAALHVRLVSTGEALPPDAVAEGFALSRRWIERHGPSVGIAERRFAYDDAWTATTWEAARFRTAIDVVTIAEEGDEDTGPQRVAVVRDYKTAWSADESELDTVQRRAQAVAVWLAHPDVDAIRLEVANLRRLTVYDRTIWLDEDGVSLLTSWREELDRLMAAADVRPRVARPGVGCIGCDYGLVCDAARTWRDASGLTDPADLLRQYAAAKATAESAYAALRAFAEVGPVVTEYGSVAIESSESSTPRPGSTVSAVLTYLRAAHVEVPDGVASALAGLPEAGATWLRAVAKALHPGRQREAREAQEAAWLDSHPTPRMVIR